MLGTQQENCPGW